MIQEYYNIYFFGVLLLSVLVVIFLSEFVFKGRQYYSIELFTLRAFSFFLFLFFGLRDVSIGTDTIHYIDDFIRLSRIESYKDVLGMTSMERDPFFAYFTFFSAKIFNSELYLLLISGVYLLSFYIFLRKNSNKGEIFLFFSFVIFFFFIQLGVNIIRNGVSIMLIMLGTSYFENYNFNKISKKTYKGLLFIFLGIMFHKSGLLLLLAFVVAKYAKFFSIRLYVILYVVSILLAYLNFSLANIPYLGPLIGGEDRLTAFIEGAVQPPSGVNPYILVFQCLILMYVTLIYKDFKKDGVFSVLVKSYLILSIFYSLCLNMYFSDRFGIFSWVIIPLILAYPLTSKVKLHRNIFLYAIFTFLYFILTIYRFYTTQI